jgi:hypothetical protein
MILLFLLYGLVSFALSFSIRRIFFRSEGTMLDGRSIGLLAACVIALALLVFLTPILIKR